MRRTRRPALPAGVKKVGERIESWRKTRKKRSPMPEELWDAAVALAQAHEVYPISRALRLNYQTLQCRVAMASRSANGGTGQAPPAGFIELSPRLPIGSPQPTGAVVELSDAEGAKLTIRLTGCSDLDVRSLADALWSRRA